MSGMGDCSENRSPGSKIGHQATISSKKARCCLLSVILF